jgi:hypothetical protein
MNDFGKNILEDVVNKHPDSYPSVKLLENFHHFVGLFNVLEGKFNHGWGSYLFDGNTYRYNREMLTKQEALYQAGEKSNNVLEVGVYLGHSLLILLLSNPNLKITCIDNDSRFSPKVVEYLNQHFDNRITFYLGDAVETLKKKKIENKFDLIHIDADHYESAVRSQFNEAKKLALPNAYFIFDDYEAVKGLIDNWIGTNQLHHVRTPWCLWTNIVTKFNAQFSSDS